MWNGCHRVCVCLLDPVGPQRLFILFYEDLFSFQSQRGAMPKNVQTIVQLLSFHMLTRLCSKSFKLGFCSMWTEKFQMYKLGLEKAEEPEIKLPALLNHKEIKRIPGQHLLLLHWLLLKPLCGSLQTTENSLRVGNTRPPCLSPEKPLCGSRSSS